MANIDFSSVEMLFQASACTASEKLSDIRHIRRFSVGFYLELINKDQEESFPYFVKQLLFACSNVLLGRMINMFHVLGVYPGSSLNCLQYSKKVFCSL